MKTTIIHVGIVLCLLVTTAVTAQEPSPVRTQTIEQLRLAITSNKTTNLVFPFAIRGVDRGSRDVLAQKAKGTDNVLQLKAGSVYFPETNLTVITSDGKLYSCTVQYADSPATQSYLFNSGAPPPVLFSPDSFNEAAVQQAAEAVLTEKKQNSHHKDERFGITLQLSGIFIKEGLMYFRIKLENSSFIGYDIEQLRFFIRDQKKPRRTASQELEVRPVFGYKDTTVIAAKSKREQVFVLQKFTIPDKKYFVIQLQEKNGGRHLRLELTNKKIVKAKPVEQ